MRRNMFNAGYINIMTCIFLVIATTSFSDDNVVISLPVKKFVNGIGETCHSGIRLEQHRFIASDCDLLDWDNVGQLTITSIIEGDDGIYRINKDYGHTLIDQKILANGRFSPISLKNIYKRTQTDGVRYLFVSRKFTESNQIYGLRNILDLPSLYTFDYFPSGSPYCHIYLSENLDIAKYNVLHVIPNDLTTNQKPKRINCSLYISKEVNNKILAGYGDYFWRYTHLDHQHGDVFIKYTPSEKASFTVMELGGTITLYGVSNESGSKTAIMYSDPIKDNEVVLESENINTIERTHTLSLKIPKEYLSDASLQLTIRKQPTNNIDFSTNLLRLALEYQQSNKNISDIKVSMPTGSYVLTVEGMNNVVVFRENVNITPDVSISINRKGVVK